MIVKNPTRPELIFFIPVPARVLRKSNYTILVLQKKLLMKQLFLYLNRRLSFKLLFEIADYLSENSRKQRKCFNELREVTKTMIRRQDTWLTTSKSGSGSFVFTSEVFSKAKIYIDCHPYNKKKKLCCDGSNNHEKQYNEKNYNEK